MHRRFGGLVFVAHIAAVVAVACGGAAAPTPTRTPAPATATSTPIVARGPSPTPGAGAGAVPTAVPTPTRIASRTHGRVVIADGRYADFDSDITRFRSGNKRALILSINDTLVARNEEAKWHGVLAESWTAAPDKWVYKIKQGVKFHDGTTMKASDIKFTLDRQMVEPFYVYRGELTASISRVETPDDSTLIIHTKQPYPAWFYRAEVGSAALPEAYYTRVGQAEYAKKPIGVGAFKFVSLDRDVRTVLTAFDDYHLGAPQVRDLVLLPVKEPSTRLAMLKTGEADMIDITGPQSLSLKDDPNYRVLVSPFGGTVGIKFWDFLDNDPTKPIMNLKVRQAFAYAIDRQAIADKIYFGYATPAGGVYNPAMVGHNPDLKPYPYDPAKARRLLTEAGFGNGFDIEYWTGTGDQTLVQGFQGLLKEVGINVKITILEESQSTVYLAQKKYRGLTSGGGSGAGPFPDAEQVLWLYYLKIGTWGAWQDDKAVQMYERVHVEMDMDTRIRLLRETEAYMYQELPSVPVVHTHTLYAANKKIDYKPTPGTAFIDPLRRLGWMPGY